MCNLILASLRCVMAHIPRGFFISLQNRSKFKIVNHELRVTNHPPLNRRRAGESRKKGDSMDNKKHCCGQCICLWFSGFFAMPAIAHIVRIILGWPMTIASWNVTIKGSIIVAVVTGILAAIFGLAGCKLAGKSEGSSCCE